MGFCLNNRSNTEGIPMYLISEFKKEIPIPLLVETGTAGGNSIKEAAKYFDECYTIELNEDRPLYDLTLTNVRWLSGNTIDVLPALVAGFVNYKTDHKFDGYRYCVFWMDSHFDGDKPADSPYKDCYLLEELDIVSWYAQDAIVIIDDARLFMGNPPHPNNPNEWPTIADIFAKFKSNFPYHFTTIVDDYIISFPDRLEWIYQREWMANYKVRFPDEADKLKSQVKDVYSALLKYIQ